MYEDNNYSDGLNNNETGSTWSSAAAGTSGTADTSETAGSAYTYSSTAGTADSATSTTQTYSSNTGSTSAAQPKAKKPKKPSVIGKAVSKVCRLAASGVVFGLIAGAVFYGVNYYADQKLGTNVITKQETQVQIPTVSTQTGKVETTSTGTLESMDVSGIVKSSMPAMVSVSGTVTTSYGYGPFFSGTTETPTAGSGVIIGQSDTELLIVTNAHVVDGVNDLQVAFSDGSVAAATVKGSKTNKDIAVIAVALSDISEETAKNIAVIEIGDSSDVEVGQPVIAIGNALGKGQSVTVGWVSSLNNTIQIDSTTYEGLIRISAAINPGNSGGALLNSDGQLIGINSAKYSDESVEGIGYAIPISSVADIINDLMNRQVRDKVDESDMGYLGIGGIDITSDINKVYGWPVGLAISQVEEGSAADAAGLVKNDIIVSFDGVDIDSMDTLRSTLQYYKSGETVTIEFYRLTDGEYVLNSTQITLGSRKQN